MGKTESNMKNMVLTLLLITLIGSAALGLVYNVTAKPIENANMTKKTMALKKVIPGDFDNDLIKDSKTIMVDKEQIIIYPAKKEGKLVGLAVESFTKKGFGGLIKVMVGFNPDGTIFNTEVLKHSETPGLGDKMMKNKSNFSLQFNGKNPGKSNLTVKKDGGEVDAITASTITSRAFCDAVKRAYEYYLKEVESK